MDDCFRSGVSFAADLLGSPCSHLLNMVKRSSKSMINVMSTDLQRTGYPGFQAYAKLPQALALDPSLS